MFIVNIQGAIWRDTGYILILRSPDEADYAGLLSWVGGKVEGHQAHEDILEATLRREIQEEIGIEISDLHYIRSNLFIAEDDEAVVNIEFLCRYAGGEPRIIDPQEVGAVLHLTPEQILDYPQCPIWITESLAKFENLRQKLGW